jgi:hypothetical protein
MDAGAYEALPSHLRDGMRRYLEEGIPTGGFLRAVLENDLMGAVKRASPGTNLLALVDWLLEHAPADAWGSVEAVSNWIQRPGARPRVPGT